MLLLQIILFSVALYFAAKRLKFSDISFLTSLKVSLAGGALMYVLQYLPYMRFFGFILIIALIKYFYRVDIKKAVYAWLISLGITFLILLAATLPYDLYKIYKNALN